MVVTLTALKRRAQENRSGRVDPIKNLVDAVFFRMHAGLNIAGHRSVKPRCNSLPSRGVRQQVSGQLVDDELIERLILVHRLNHPVAIGPAVADLIGLKAVRVGISGQIQPGTRPMFSVRIRGQQAIYDALVGPNVRVGKKSVQLLKRRRQAGQGQRRSTQQGRSVGFLGRRPVLLFQSSQDESVDRIDRPFRVGHLNQRRP